MAPIRVADGPSGAAPAAGIEQCLAGNIFELSTTPMLLIDDAQRIHSANAAAGVMFQCSDLDRRSVRDVLVPDDDLQSRMEMTALAGDKSGWLDHGYVILPNSGWRLRVSVRVDLVTAPGDPARYLMQLSAPSIEGEHEVARGRGESHYRHLVSTVPGMSVLVFDRDLRLLRAGGEVLARGRFSAESMAGKLLSDVVPAQVVALIGDRFRAALEGQEADFDYDSPIDGRQYRIRLRPITDDDGTITTALALSEDVTADRARRTLLEQMQQLSKVGTVAYSQFGGWRADDELLDLLGLNSSSEVQQALDNLVLPEDRAPTRSAYRAVLAAGGRTTVQYRVVHGKTGQLRHVMGAVEAVVDAEGTLLRALATHADITEAVQAQAAEVAAAQARTVLLRSVSDAFAKAPGSLLSVMQSIVDIAAAALGDSTVLRILTADATGVEIDLVADSDEMAKNVMTECLRESARTFCADTLDVTGPAGALLSTVRDPHGRSTFRQRLACPAMKPIHHFISAAVRHDGLVLGYLHVYRADPNNPYQDGDDHLIQVLADRIGSAIAESRVRDLLERQRTERSAIAIRLHELTVEQRELLEQLSGVEERERLLLAEAIHDGPMQLVVAVMMRLENFSMTGVKLVQDGLESSIETLETSIRNLRTLIIALTPPDLSRGLGVALRQLAEGIFMGTTTEITVLGKAHVNLTPLTKVNAHRILREALVNTRKHAHARHVVLELTEDDDVVIARLTDDGIGATSLDSGPGHLGVATMRARADAEGASLDIVCTAGVGTTVLLTLPTATMHAGH